MSDKGLKRKNAPKKKPTKHHAKGSKGGKKNVTKAKAKDKRKSTKGKNKGKGKAASNAAKNAGKKKTTPKKSDGISAADANKFKPIAGSFGQIGDVPFKVHWDWKDDKELVVQSFQNMQITHSARTSELNYINGDPKLIWNGRNRSQATFDIVIMRSLGVNVDQAYSTLCDYVDTGESLKFVIGGRNVFEHDAMITNLELQMQDVNNKGVINAFQASLTVEEV